MARDVQITFDCADPAGLSAFWAEALGYRLQDPPEGFESWDQALEAIGVPPERRNDASGVVDPEGSRPRLFFQRVPEDKLRELRTDEQPLPHVVHLDINVGHDKKAEHHEVDADVQRLAGLGARDPQARRGLGSLIHGGLLRHSGSVGHQTLKFTSASKSWAEKLKPRASATY